MADKAKINCAYQELLALDDPSIIPNPDNPNDHSEDQIERLAKIIDYQGQRSPIVISNLSGFITKGHGRLMAIKKLGWEKIAVDYQDYENKAQEWADIVADNAIAEWSILDLSKINDEALKLEELDIDMLGIKDFEVTVSETLDPGCDEDDAPEPPEEPVTKRGDIWLLGDHRLMCGDSTLIDDIERLMNKQKTDIAFTSPPYNVGKTPNGNDKKYLNDTDDKQSVNYAEFLSTFTLNSLFFSDYVFVNIQSLSGNKTALIDYMYKMKSFFADTLIWDKKTAEPAMARKVLNSRFEYVHVFSNEAKRSIGKKDFRGTVSNIFELNSRQGKEYSKVHKATLPVQLPEFFIKTFCESSCMDPFTGTGTTLIASEKSSVSFYGMELEPSYCDISIMRWQKYAGKEAKLESTGETYKQLKEARNGQK